MAAQLPVWLQTTEVVLDALATASWPIAIGISLFAFRKPITGLLSRMRKLNSFGNEAEFLPLEAASDQKAEKSNVPQLPANNAGALPANPPPEPVYDVFDANARQILEAHFPNDQDQQLAWAIRMRSISEANRIHETNYRLVFGSQIAALKALNTVGRARAEEFRPFFEKAATNPDWQFIHEGRTFEEWGQFLIDAGYVHLVEGTDPELVQITPFGQQFLVWMTTARVIETKIG